MRWQELARRQHGVLTRRQLDSLGLTDGQIDALRARGDLIRDPQRRGLWRAASAPSTPLTACWAAVLSSGSIVSHRSAAAIHGFCPPPIAQVHVTEPERRRIRVPSAVRIHRVPVPAGEVVEVEGLRVTSPSRTIIECLRTEPLRSGRDLLDRSLQRRWIALWQLDTEIAERAGRWGTKKLVRLRAECAMGDAASERKLHALLRRAGIVGWTANAPVDVGFAVLRFDVVFERIKLIIELDGWAFHIDPKRFRADRTRQNAAVECGWTIRRYTWHDVVDRPDYVIASVRRAIVQLS